jgi:hypothetical protein
MYQHLLGRRVRVSTTAASEQGSLHRGEYAEIVEWGADPESLELTRLDVRLGSGKIIELTPAEVEVLDY